MATYYAYSAPERKEYLDFCGSAFDGVRCNLANPVERAQAEVLHSLLLGPWNGCVIRCDGHDADYPWDDPDGSDDPIGGWRSVNEVHEDLVESAVAHAQHNQRKGLD